MGLDSNRIIRKRYVRAFLSSVVSISLVLLLVGIAGKRQLTVGNYIDNVLKEHFEKHADEVKTYLQKSYNKIF